MKRSAATTDDGETPQTDLHVSLQVSQSPSQTLAPALPAYLAGLSPKARALYESGMDGAPNTKRAYQSDLRHFKRWCAREGLTPFPTAEGDLANYISYCVDLHPLDATSKHFARTRPDATAPQGSDGYATVLRRLAAIRKAHDLFELPYTGQDSRVVQKVLNGVRRTTGTQQLGAKAFTFQELTTVLSLLNEDNPQEFRNKVLLLVGFFGAFRRSELVALNLHDLQPLVDGDGSLSGFVLHMDHAKTNQTGEKMGKLLPRIETDGGASLCPARTLERYLSSLQQQGFVEPASPLFTHCVKVSRKNPRTPYGVKRGTNRLGDSSVNKIVKEYFGAEYSAHSLRVSFVTEARRRNSDDSSIMSQTHHKTVSMIHRYTRFQHITDHNAALTFG